MSSHRSSSTEAQDNIRKRVCKACDRCRLKKSKCDGANPCSRCKADNAICVFGERKKSQDKVYPKGYVEMLEQQQLQLVAGLRQLYGRLQKGESWPGQPLREAPGGFPLTHDILERLDLLHSTGDSSNYEGFEEDPQRMQQKLLDRGAAFTRRRGSVSSESDHGHATSPSSYSGTPTTQSFGFDHPFLHKNIPPTPPMNSPFPRQSQIITPMKQDPSIVSPTFANTGALDPSALSRPTWLNDTVMLDEPVDFTKPMYTFDNFANFDQTLIVNTMALDSGDPMMSDWNSPNDLDFSTFIQNPVGA